MCLWAGIYLICLPGLAQDPRKALLGLLGPASVVVLLRFVSGVPPLDAAAERRWGDLASWREYRRTTSLLVPWRRRPARRVHDKAD
jgi:steroid 5-alpha reductase family enzyme